jgi:hypothetical protein
LSTKRGKTLLLPYLLNLEPVEWGEYPPLLLQWLMLSPRTHSAASLSGCGPHRQCQNLVQHVPENWWATGSAHDTWIQTSRVTSVLYKIRRYKKHGVLYLLPMETSLMVGMTVGYWLQYREPGIPVIFVRCVNTNIG